ncbi:uncharacterized protein VTP21DRAFT_3576 [Calcarisporiella thermophila]|uniref:uncharacterized protein n=1 Tax=Calcarisporiella thermophila TaxID=911321 RepID=UPI003741FAEE
MTVEDRSSTYVILYASQTGTAESIALSIQRDAEQKGYQGQCIVMDDYEKINFESERVYIFVTSNTGDGDPPDNSTKFWRYMRKLSKGKESPFTGARIAILGLGDTNYDNFNNTAKRLEKRLADQGAVMFYEKGLADDATGLEAVVEPWIAGLWPALAKVCISSKEGAAIPGSIPEAPITVDKKEVEEPKPNSTAKSETFVNGAAEPENDLSVNIEGLRIDSSNMASEAVGHPIAIDRSELDSAKELTGLPRLQLPLCRITSIPSTPSDSQPARSSRLPEFVATPTPIQMAKLKKAQVLTKAGALKRTLHLELEIPESDQPCFEPGDAFGIICPNQESLVSALLKRLNIENPDARIQVEGVKGDASLPSHLKQAKNTTLRELFTYALDLVGIPRKALFRMLAEYTSNPDEKKLLWFLCSKQGATEFNKLRDQLPNLLDILTTFPSCCPPPERLLDTLPAHQPRYYSIANSPFTNAHSVRFAFNVVEYTTPSPYNVARRGVCTPWLDGLSGRLPAGDPLTDVASRNVEIPVFFKPNEAFHLPADTRKPLLLIGPGTGVAPFVGFLEHREQQRTLRRRMGGIGGRHPSRDVDAQFGEIWLFYGCRHRELDFLFREQLERYREDNIVSELVVAVSRESSEGPKYVQDHLRMRGREVYSLIEERGAMVFVCGDAKGMAKGVHDALTDIYVEHGGMERMQAMRQLARLMEENRYVRDLWA